MTRTSGARRRLRNALWSGVVALLLCLPAAVNGFPLVFEDSAHYLRKPYALLSELSRGRFSTEASQYRTYLPSHFGGGEAAAASSGATETGAAPSPPVEAAARLSGNPFFLRPAAYSLALLPFAHPVTILLVPFVQALLVVMLSAAVLRALAGPEPPIGLRLAAAAALLLSAAPWLASQLMPDVLTGCLVLWLVLLACGTSPLAKPWRAALFAGLGAFLIASHLTHLPLATTGVLVGLGMGWGLAGARYPLLRRRLAVACAALALAAGSLVGTNLVFARRATLSESSPLFILARLVGDGTAGRVLASDCPAGAEWLLCRHPDYWSVPSDWFLWDTGAPWLRHWAERDRFLAEASEIGRLALRRHPLDQLRASLSNWDRQTVTMGIEPQLTVPPKSSFVELAQQMGDPARRLSETSLQSTAPALLERYRSLQDWVQENIFLLALFGLSAALILALRNATTPIPLQATGLVIALVLGNALLAGTLAAVHPRYQSRVTWPVAVVALAVAGGALRHRATACATPRPAGRGVAHAEDA